MSEHYSFMGHTVESLEDLLAIMECLVMDHHYEIDRCLDVANGSMTLRFVGPEGHSYVYAKLDRSKVSAKVKELLGTE